MNFNKVKAVVQHQFEWHKNIFFVIVITMLAVKISSELFKQPLILVLGLPLTFFASFFIRPDFTGMVPGFSAKYLLSFPLTRRELIVSQILVCLFAYSPLILWIGLFYKYVQPVMNLFDSPSTAAFVSLSAILALGAYKQNFALKIARGTHGQVQQNLGWQFLKVFLTFMLMGGAFGLFSFYLVQAHGVNIHKGIDVILVILSTKWLGVLFLLAALYNFFYSLKLSHKDKLSFLKPFNLKNDSIFLGAQVALNGFCLWLATSAIPQMFQGDLQIAIYNSEDQEVHNLISAGADVNKPNKYGMTPMMVALHQGDLPMIKLLEENGANYSGEVYNDEKVTKIDARFIAVLSNNTAVLNYIKNKVPSFDQSNSAKTHYPIQLAALTCRTESIDFLIKDGVNVDSHGPKSLPAVVMAANKNCFKGVVSLKEAGARFDFKNSKGKLALNSLPEHVSPELKEFIQMSMRAPASK